MTDCIGDASDKFELQSDYSDDLKRLGISLKQVSCPGQIQSEIRI